MPGHRAWMLDDYVRRLMLEEERQSDFVSTVEEGFGDVEAGRVRPAREARS
jgi:hypothetical protein